MKEKGCLHLRNPLTSLNAQNDCWLNNELGTGIAKLQWAWINERDKKLHAGVPVPHFSYQLLVRKLLVSHLISPLSPCIQEFLAETWYYGIPLHAIPRVWRKLGFLLKLTGEDVSEFRPQMSKAQLAAVDAKPPLPSKDELRELDHTQGYTNVLVPKSYVGPGQMRE